jgi:hypothetical protein
MSHTGTGPPKHPSHQPLRAVDEFVRACRLEEPLLEFEGTVSVRNTDEHYAPRDEVLHRFDAEPLGIIYVLQHVGENDDLELLGCIQPGQVLTEKARVWNRRVRAGIVDGLPMDIQPGDLISKKSERGCEVAAIAAPDLQNAYLAGAEIVVQSVSLYRSRDEPELLAVTVQFQRHS